MSALVRAAVAPLVFLLLAGAVLVAAAAPVLAQATGELEVTVERDTRERLDLPLQAPLLATITKEGAPPVRDFDVFASAENAAGERTDPFECVEEEDAGVPPGAYACSVFVTRGGLWTFTVFVNQYQEDPDAVPVMLAQGTTEFEVVSDFVSTDVPEEVSADTMDVAALFGHSLAGAAWFGCAAILVLLALPQARSRLSSSAVSALESRLDILPRVTWTFTAVVVGSGAYMLVNLVPYDTPFTPEAFDQRSLLPYGRPYFLSLGAKLAVYAAMVLLTPALIREARRRARLESISDEPTRWVSATTAALAVGAPLIVLCVTLLKYFHELIEASRAVT